MSAKKKSAIKGVKLDLQGLHVGPLTFPLPIPMAHRELGRCSFCKQPAIAEITVVGGLVKLGGACTTHQAIIQRLMSLI